MQYNEPVFRPPAEGNSLILQITHGCKWNKCHFCEMYSTKDYAVRAMDEIGQDINYLAKYYPQTKRLFLGDGDALSIGYSKLLYILNDIKHKMPWLTRISAYASAKELLSFTEDELLKIKQEGLSLLYVGIESGDDKTLKLINKGINSDKQLNALKKAKTAGLRLSVMILNGLGGRAYSTQHAENTAKLLNQLQPELLSFLTVSFPRSFEFFKSKLNEQFEALSPLELAKEVKLLISKLELKHTVFRSDHVSNLMPLKGGLGRDKQRLLSELDYIIDHISSMNEGYINESRIL